MKQACVSLIKKWVSYYNNDIIKLLTALDVEGKVDLCGEVVTEILSHVHVDSAIECLLSRIENKGKELDFPINFNLKTLEIFTCICYIKSAIFFLFVVLNPALII